MLRPLFLCFCRRIGTIFFSSSSSPVLVCSTLAGAGAAILGGDAFFCRPHRHLHHHYHFMLIVSHGVTFRLMNFFVIYCNNNNGTQKNIFVPNCGVALYHCVTNFGTCSKYQFGLFTLHHSSFSVSVSLHVISLITVNISFTNHFGNVRYSMSFGWRRRHHSSHSRVTLVTGTCQRCQYIHITGKELVKLWWYWALLRVCAWYLNSILTFKKKNVLRRQHKKLPFYEDSTRDERERK